MENYLIRLLMKVSFNAILIILTINVFTQLSFANRSEAQSIAEVQITLTTQDASLEEVIEIIEQETEFKFAYLDRTAKENGFHITVDFTNKSVEEILQEVAQQTGLSFRQVNETISIKKYFNEKDVVAPINKSATPQQEEVNISGKVTEKSGEPLPGVSVYVKGTTIGVTTNFDGEYNLSVPGNSETLVFSFMGMSTQEIKISGKTVIDVVMSEEALGLDEVVVTALGIEREKKALGYSVQEVEGDDLSGAKELDVVNSLSGRVAGVNITQGSGSLGGGGSRIVIRGETSLAGNNDPLFIIDGIPGGSNDVAPDDIETISVLKGPAAAALYGSRAASGVVLITTKTGNGSTGIGIDFNSSSTWQEPLVLPNYQNEYGQGKAGRYSYYDGNNGGIEDDTRLSWGPKFDGELRPQFTGNDPWVAHPNNVEDFYDTGYILHNNIALAGGNDNGNFRFSYTNIQQNGIIPNTGYSSNRFDMNGGWTFAEKLKLSASVKYSKNNTENNTSYDPRFVPRSIDFNGLKDYWVPGLEGYQQKTWRRSSNNPYFLLYENTNSSVGERFVGNITLSYDFNQYLNFLARAGTTSSNSTSWKKEAFSTAGDIKKQNGSFRNNSYSGHTDNADFLLTFDKYIVPDNLSMKLSFGGNHMRHESYSLQSYINQLVYFDIFNLGNYGEKPTTGNSITKKEVNSLYAFANFGYKSSIYFDVTARNDWSSTLPEDNNSYFYSSFALTGVMNEIISLPESISFWKLRGSWAKVGNDTEPYRLETTHAWKHGETAELQESSTKANSDLKPELTTAYELGTDIRFFNNRLSLDFTYYNSVTSNQIIKLETSISSRYQYWMLNAGEISNKGYEVMLSGVPVTNGNFSWDIMLNWSWDRAYVDELLPGEVDEITQQVTGHLFIIDKVGERRGAFYGKGYQRAPSGELLLDKSGDTKRGAEKYLGNYNPDWIASLINNFSYKNLSLSFMLDYRHGGTFYSQSLYRMNMYGLSEATLLGDREGIVPDGVVEEEDGSYRPITIDDLGGKGMSGEQYWANMMDEEIPEAVLVDGTYLKLRELKFSYNVPSSVLGNGAIQSASISLVGRNLAVWSNVEHVDPETYGVARERTSSGRQLKVLGYDSSSIPSLRNIGFTINLKF